MVLLIDEKLWEDNNSVETAMTSHDILAQLKNEYFLPLPYEINSIQQEPSSVKMK